MPKFKIDTKTQLNKMKKVFDHQIKTLDVVVKVIDDIKDIDYCNNIELEIISCYGGAKLGTVRMRDVLEMIVNEERAFETDYTLRRIECLN